MTPSVTDRGEWLGAERARAWATVLAAMSGLVLLGLLIGTRGGSAPDSWGRPLAPDFSSFWTAARMALAGNAASVWEPVSHYSEQRVLFPAAAGFHDDYYGFFYPPTFLLLLLPFGLLPYGMAVGSWVVATGTAYLLALRRLLPHAWSSVLAGLAFPALLVNMEHGQNGALTAALWAGGAGLLDRRPMLAGACLGGLSVKPHLGLLVVPALLAARRWRALAGMAASALGLCVGSWLVFEGEAWRSFLANGTFALTALEAGLVGDAKMVSVFAGVRLLGAGTDVAWVAQGAAAAMALLVVVGVARRRPGGAAEMAVTGVAAFLATPFVLDYDLLVVSVPLAWVVSEASRTGFRPREKLMLLASFALPLMARTLALRIGLPIVPAILAGLLGVILARLPDGCVVGQA